MAKIDRDKIVPEQTDFGFGTPPDEGFHRFVVKEFSYAEGDDGLKAQAVCEVSKGENAGLGLTDNYSFESKNMFGLKKLLALCMSTGVIPPGKKRTVGWFYEEEHLDQLKERIEGKEFVGEVKYTKGEKGTFANLNKYLTLEEAEEQGALKKGKPKAKKEEAEEEEEEKPKKKKREEDWD